MAVKQEREALAPACTWSSLLCHFSLVLDLIRRVWTRSNLRTKAPHVSLSKQKQRMCKATTALSVAACSVLEGPHC